MNDGSVLGFDLSRTHIAGWFGKIVYDDNKYYVKTEIARIDFFEKNNTDYIINTLNRYNLLFTNVVGIECQPPKGARFVEGVVNTYCRLTAPKSYVYGISAVSKVRLVTSLSPELPQKTYRLRKRASVIVAQRLGLQTNDSIVSILDSLDKADDVAEAMLIAIVAFARHRQFVSTQ